MATMRYQQALRLAMTEEMERDPNVFLCGEEVGQYQGTYRVTEGMLDKFGPRRVVDTPISEIGIAGMATGSAMVGLRPVAEFMTWSFALEAMDQLVNHAAKITYMSGGRIQCPVVFRGPAGVGTQLSAQHSQSMESWYAHTPGLKVAMPATAADAKGLLKTAIRDDNPVIYMETVLQSVRKTHHAVAVHEEWRNVGFAAELSARIHEQAFDDLDAPVERVAGADVPMPYAKNLERAAIPTDNDVIAAVKKTLA